MTCIFCSVVRDELPSIRIYEDEATVAFMDISPASRGHSLVVPRRHADDLIDAGADDLSACARTAQVIADRAIRHLGADGVNLLSCCGAPAGQTVFHLHLHVIPRYAGAPFTFPWAPAAGDPGEIAAAAAALRRP